MLTRRGDFILVAGKFPRLVAPEIEKRLPEILELLRQTLKNMVRPLVSVTGRGSIAVAVTALSRSVGR